ncbi:Glucose-methanol-choline oxidoreductase [Macrophomina phaseolina MS6]|uniref:Glucose-methanol-choline oxidoreductase n=1 Tax=Macrophomina phaseolina (strain MS6) TaxID=1126212 RepID=K2RGN4_MACPH|nr:Glucose-methanol-choline oxidoreductase [Macrophomina phaseolina MS6]
MSWDLSVHGSDGPVQASYAPFMYESIKYFFRAWHSLGVPTPKDPGAGSKAGVFWAPSSKDPTHQTRSSARTAHHDRAASRPNYHLLTMHAATKLLFSANVATGVEYVSRETGETGSVNARKEVVLSAGTVHTTQLLQLSGIGPESLLNSLGIDVLVDLPVGYNLQDHPTLYSSWDLADEPIPNPSYFASNLTYQNESLALYYSSGDGPYTISRGATVCFLPLANITDSATFAAITALARATNASAVYPALAVPAAVAAGYEAQKQLTIAAYASPDTSVKESSFLGGGTMTVVMLKPLSRGTIFVHTRDPLVPPAIDYGAMLAPSDMPVMLAALRKARAFMAAPAMRELRPAELAPGANLTTDAQLDAALRASLSPTFAHVCCTAPMMARDQGGVVDADLRVYGVSGLRVVDASLMPLLPATHTSSTVYAVAEKAADLIKKAYS